MASIADFVGLDQATLTELKTTYLEAIKAVADGQSYTIGNRTVTRASLPELRNTMAAINYALNRLSTQSAGRSRNRTAVRFSF